MFAVTSLPRYVSIAFLSWNMIPIAVCSKYSSGNNCHLGSYKPLLLIIRCPLFTLSIWTITTAVGQRTIALAMWQTVSTVWSGSCPFFLWCHAAFRQPPPRSVDRMKWTSCLAFTVTQSISLLLTSACGAIWRASFMPNSVTYRTSCGMPFKWLGWQYATCLMSFSGPGTLAQQGRVFIPNYFGYFSLLMLSLAVSHYWSGRDHIFVWPYLLV
jgi:hypothetical protein